jgi:undecaprenyl-diphosphatase
VTSAHAILLGFVEALTEFLPVSSTGHLILTSHFLGIGDDPFVKDFSVIIQFAAIFAVLLLYWRRFLSGWSIYKELTIAFIPAAVLGLALKNKIDVLLGSVEIVAWALIIGGLVLIWVDSYFKNEKLNRNLNQMNLKDAFVIGLAQCLAFVPGVSRSAATIIGGLSRNFDRKSAAEFSFLLAVPTLLAASVLKLYKIRHDLNGENFSLLVIGGLVAFLGSIVVMKVFIQMLNKYGFRWFGYYRILVGVFILILTHLSDTSLKLL